MSFLSIFVPIAGFIGLISIVIYKVSKNPKANPLDVYPNSPIIFSPTKTQFTDKGYVLLEKDLKINKNGTYTVSCYKLDHKQGEDAPKPRLYKFVVLKENLITISTEGDRVIKMLVGKNSGDYPEEVKRTKLGQAMLKAGMSNYIEDMSNEAHKEKDKTIRSMFIDNAYGEISRNTYGRLKENTEKAYDLMNLMNREKKDEN